MIKFVLLPLLTILSTETNPFARKAGTDNTRNPFARKSDPNKTIQKSESFFDKIDTVDEDGGSKPKRTSSPVDCSLQLIINYTLTDIGPVAKSNGKEKERSNTVSRQTTLFGMLPPQPKDKQKKNNPFSKTKGGDDSTAATVAPQVDTTPDADPQVIDTQITDVMMSDAATLVDSSQSQVLDESGWEETQMVQDADETQVSLSLFFFLFVRWKRS